MKKLFALIFAILSLSIFCFVGCNDPFDGDYDPDNGNGTQQGGSGGGASSDDDDGVNLPYVPF